MKSNEVIQKAANKIGVKALAAEMNLSGSLVYKWCQDKEGDHPSGSVNPLDRVLSIVSCTKDTGPLEWLCERAGGFFVRNPDVTKQPHPDALQMTPRILKEFSELLDEVANSINDDQRISASEAERIRNEWEDLKRIAECFVSACEKGVYNMDTSS